MHGLSAKFSRYLSDSITPPSHAQDQEHQHGACAAELPGICDVNLVSPYTGRYISPSVGAGEHFQHDNAHTNGRGATTAAAGEHFQHDNAHTNGRGATTGVTLT